MCEWLSHDSVVEVRSIELSNLSFVFHVDWLLLLTILLEKFVEELISAMLYHFQLVSIPSLTLNLLNVVLVHCEVAPVLLRALLAQEGAKCDIGVCRFVLHAVDAVLVEFAIVHDFLKHFLDGRRLELEIVLFRRSILHGRHILHVWIVSLSEAGLRFY